jgi:hypothetical protein
MLCSECFLDEIREEDLEAFTGCGEIGRYMAGRSREGHALSRI